MASISVAGVRQLWGRADNNAVVVQGGGVDVLVDMAGPTKKTATVQKGLQYSFVVSIVPSTGYPVYVDGIEERKVDGIYVGRRHCPGNRRRHIQSQWRWSYCTRIESYARRKHT